MLATEFGTADDHAEQVAELLCSLCIARRCPAAPETLRSTDGLPPDLAAAGRPIDASDAGSTRSAPDRAHVAICVGNRARVRRSGDRRVASGLRLHAVEDRLDGRRGGAVLDDARTSVVITDREVRAAASSRGGLATVDVDADYEQWLTCQDPSAARRPLRLQDALHVRHDRAAEGVVMAGSGATPFARLDRAGAVGEHVRLPGDGVHLFVSRLFNGAPQTFGFGAMARGATLRILPRWEPRAALAALASDDVTSTHHGADDVPAAARAARHRPDDPAGPNLRTVLHGGEPCPVPVKEQIAAWFGDVLVEYYGFTEGGHHRRQPGRLAVTAGHGRPAAARDARAHPRRRR